MFAARVEPIPRTATSRPIPTQTLTTRGLRAERPEEPFRLRIDMFYATPSVETTVTKSKSEETEVGKLNVVA